MVGDLEYPHRQACLPRQRKSHPDTGRSLQSCIFIVQESGEGIVRLPEHPLIEDSLSFLSSEWKYYALLGVKVLIMERLARRPKHLRSRRRRRGATREKTEKAQVPGPPATTPG